MFYISWKWTLVIVGIVLLLIYFLCRKTTPRKARAVKRREVTPTPTEMTPTPFELSELTPTPSEVFDPDGEVTPFNPKEFSPFRWADRSPHPILEHRDYPSKGERMTCRALERIYRKPFKSARPDFLRNPETGQNLELDCYNEELKIAGEFNGRQHYEFPNHLNMTKEDFIKQVRRDQYKLEQCNRNGVYLIRVPYTVPYGQIENFIKWNCPEEIKRRRKERLGL